MKKQITLNPRCNPAPAVQFNSLGRKGSSLESHPRHLSPGNEGTEHPWLKGVRPEVRAGLGRNGPSMCVGVSATLSAGSWIWESPGTSTHAGQAWWGHWGCLPGAPGVQE